MAQPPTSSTHEAAAGSSLRHLLAHPAARNLILRVFVVRIATSGFTTAIATLVAIQAHLAWLPGMSSGLAGLAALGVISAAGSAASLAVNGPSQRVVERYGVRRVLGTAAAAQAVIVGLFGSAALAWGQVGLGVLGLAVTTFLFSATSPGIAALAQGWWHALDLSPELSARGSVLEPTLSASAWTVGPAIAAPLVLISPDFTIAFGIASVVGWLLVSRLPDQNPAAKVKTRVGKVAGLHDWWMSASYSLYHVARALLGAGSTAVLVGAGQAGLVGATSAAPSAGHILGGLVFAARKNPTQGLARAVYRGLAGQAIPTAVIALVFVTFPHPGAIASAVLLVGGGVLIGILKAPVAGAIYPLAATARPHLTAGRSAAIMTQGITVGGLVGPLIGTAIVSTVGPVWLLPASCLSLILCGLGVSLDGAMERALSGRPAVGVVEIAPELDEVAEAA